ncbi:hypothetical protein [Saccharothrix syringae]|uniref:Uncharacterized protein n=1 Tax=Saccharothrix syringae TaxID=103733 RepID=A0A5Q0GWT8_SACSY|nr:hypothetical protein [Saccharothrix syringae]QFZ18135.1 hypothetical protein EKG83_12160 [Saccharothrix syringae]
MSTSSFDEVGRRGREQAPPPFTRFVPHVLPAGLLVAGNDAAKVFLVAAWCWPDCVTLDLAVFARDPEVRVPPLFRHPLATGSGPGPSGPVLAVSYADGRRFTTLDRYDGAPVGDAALRATPGRSSGGPGHRRESAHLAPLPPAGPVVLAARWDDLGLVEGRVEISGADVLAGAARARPVWG